MSNRQARREQSKATRTQRAANRGGSRRGSGGGPRRPGGGSWITQPFTLITIGFGLILAVVLGVVLVITGGGDSEEAVVALEAARGEIPVEMASGAKLGSDDAPLKLTQFEDFQCPFCLRYTAEQEPVLIEEYVKTGKLQIIFQHFPALGRESLWAANAASCAADQNKFWEYANELFLVQAKEGQLDDESLNVGRFDLDDLQSLGTAAGVSDQPAFDSCVADLEHQEDVVDQQRRAQSVGLTGTPSFLLNDVPLTASGAPSSLDDWRAVLDDTIAQIENPTLVPVEQTATPEPTEAPASGDEETATPVPAEPTPTPEPTLTAEPTATE